MKLIDSPHYPYPRSQMVPSTLLLIPLSFRGGSYPISNQQQGHHTVPRFLRYCDAAQAVLAQNGYTELKRPADQLHPQSTRAFSLPPPLIYTTHRIAASASSPLACFEQINCDRLCQFVKLQNDDTQASLWGPLKRILSWARAAKLPNQIPYSLAS